MTVKKRKNICNSKGKAQQAKLSRYKLMEGRKYGRNAEINPWKSGRKWRISLFFILLLVFLSPVTGQAYNFLVAITSLTVFNFTLFLPFFHAVYATFRLQILFSLALYWSLCLRQQGRLIISLWSVSNFLQYSPRPNLFMHNIQHLVHVFFLICFTACHVSGNRARLYFVLLRILIRVSYIRASLPFSYVIFTAFCPRVLLPHLL